MAAAAPVLPEQFLQSSDVKVEELLDAVVPRARRGPAPSELALEVDVKPGEGSLIAIRHESGALTFHQSADRARRGARRGVRGGSVDRYRIPLRHAAGPAAGRRGVIATAVKVVVMKVAKAAVDKAVSVAMPILARQAESLIWTKLGISEGWFKVRPTGGTLELTPGAPSPGERCLLLVHGTFSHTAAAFSALAGSDFFDRVRPLYGDRVFAFNHFSVSSEPIENGRMLVSGLKAGNYPFDAVTHSRGGLVLRAVVEQRDRLGSPLVNVNLGHAVLVAAPNDGTPLATPNRWEETIGWFANLLELFPENPLTTAAEFISEAVVWLASHLAGDLPGLRSMDGAGDLIANLQLPPGPAPNLYSALVSNFHPDSAVLARALDVGVDEFFASANDLVVPSEGGWRIDRDITSVPGNRIGCFGPGGNLSAARSEPVHHLNFFKHAESVAFIATALAGRPQTKPSIDPAAPLPSHRISRRSTAAPVTVAAERTEPLAAGPLATPSTATSAAFPDDDFDTLHIVVMNKFNHDTGERMIGGEQPNFAQVYASYGGARVTTPMRLHADRKDRKNTRTAFGDIIRTHQNIQRYTNEARGTLPSEDELKTFGAQLFDTLFQGDVRRLYDEARSRQRGRRLDLVLTSMIPWIGEKPWEFSYDKSRESFLATEEIHFIRNVLTSVPADSIAPINGPLRILVAAAQPVSFGMLSIDEEVAVIRRDFEPLIEAGLVQIDVLARVTPAALHGYLSTGRYNALHFIGHGEYSEKLKQGCLIFEDGRGNANAIGERQLREIFCKRGLSLVFLNACQSGTGGLADFNKGVAQAMVSHGLPALVANQYSVLDSSATSFAQHFYFCLAQGFSLGQAARESRIAVNYALNGEAIDWAIPVLYARDPNRTLCSRPVVPIRVATTRTAQSVRRRPAPSGAKRIMVWDVDQVFPQLARTLKQMNAAQSTYVFEVARMSIPLDVWDYESEPGTPYLDAERLADRLKGKPGELHADLLCCLTRHWMGDSEWLNLFAWWSGDQKPQIAVISFAGFPELQTSGLETDRAIANNLVAVMTGFWGNLDSHKSGPKNCPLYFNGERDWKYVGGELQFHAECLKKMRAAKLGDQMPALQALLETFKPLKVATRKQKERG